jgi:hypothetical protein
MVIIYHLLKDRYESCVFAYEFFLKTEIISMFPAGTKIHVHPVVSWATSEISHTTFIWLVHLFITAL